MDERDRIYSRMNAPHLYGRGVVLDKLVHDFDAGCTIFGLDGVGGVGKSELADRLAGFVAERNELSHITIDVSESSSESLLIAAIYSRLREVPRSTEQQIESAGQRFAGRAIGAVGRVLAAMLQDAVVYANEKLENTAEAIRLELTGEATKQTVADQLEIEESANQRLIIREYMQFVADLGNQVVLVLDNCENAQPSAQETIRFLLKAKPENWVLILVADTEISTDENWNRRLAPFMARERGTVTTLDSPATDSLADWFEDEMGRRPAEEEIAAMMRASNGGRPMYVAEYLKALRNGDPRRSPPDLTRLHAARRSSRTRDARRLAELIALAGPNMVIARNLLAAAAEYDGISFGAALDELDIAGEIVARDGGIAFTHASHQGNWRSAMDDAAVEECRHAWFKVYRDLRGDIMPLAGSGLLPQLSSEIAVEDSGGELSRVALQLVETGAQNEALGLLDAALQGDAGMRAGTGGLIEHGLLAAQTRLDMGRYREAQESLRMVELRGGQSLKQTITADLIRLTLALRQNSYGVVWALSEKLARNAADDPGVQLECELVVNTARRDLNDQEGIRESLDRLLEGVETASPSLRAKADRSIARSFAKLGLTDDAVAMARRSLRGAEGEGDLRAIGNAQLALAEALRYAGRTVEALAAYNAGEDLARGTGNRDGQIWCLLGQACTYLQDERTADARATAQSVDRIVTEPGFEHPLEFAHLGLIEAIADLIDGIKVEETAILARYEQLGIGWPADYLRRVADARGLPGPIPI